MEDYIRIEKLPEIPGSFGPRYLVPAEYLESTNGGVVHDIFKVLNVWGQFFELRTNSEGVPCRVYELPPRHTVEANPLLMYYLDSLNCQIIG